MNYWHFIFIALLPVTIIFSKEIRRNQTPIVHITTSSNVKYIKVPTSDDPVLVWIEVRKGVYPNITNDSSLVANVAIGEPITLLIFYKDSYNLYRIKVIDCWAYDNQIVSLSKHKLHLCSSNSKCTGKIKMTEWKKSIPHNKPYFLYSSFTAFKFPDKDQVYLSCEVELYGKEQSS